MNYKIYFLVLLALATLAEIAKGQSGTTISTSGNGTGSSTNGSTTAPVSCAMPPRLLQSKYPTACIYCISQMTNVYINMLYTQNPQTCYDSCLDACVQQFPCTSTSPCCLIPLIGDLFCNCNPDVSTCRKAFACKQQCKQTCLSAEAIAKFQSGVMLNPLGMCVELGCSDCYSVSCMQGTDCSSCINDCGWSALGTMQNTVIPCLQAAGNDPTAINNCAGLMPTPCFTQCLTSGCGGSGCTDCCQSLGSPGCGSLCSSTLTTTTTQQEGSSSSL